MPPDLYHDELWDDMRGLLLQQVPLHLLLPAPPPYPSPLPLLPAPPPVIFLPDSLPESHQHGVKGLNPIRCGSLGQGSESKGCYGTDLLLLIHETVLNDLHQALEVGQHRTAHEDGNLLHDLDPSVARLHEGEIE